LAAFEPLDYIIGYTPFYKNNLDTLNFYQLTQSANAGVSHNFGKQNWPNLPKMYTKRKSELKNNSVLQWFWFPSFCKKKKQN
jgi:hypothetical protein